MQRSLYISPLSLLEWKSGKLPSATDIRKARNRHLAELEASGGISLAIHGTEYTKNDIISLFDSMLADKRFPYHLQVSRDSALLRFLETGSYSPKHPFLRNTRPDKSFMKWLQPHFASAFAVLLKDGIETGNAQNIAALLQETVTLDSQYESIAWNPLYSELLKAAAAIELINDTRIRYADLISLISLAKVAFLQLLYLKPEGLFYSELYEYIRLLHNRIYAYSFTSSVFCIFHNLLNIKFEGTLRTRCEEAIKYYPDMNVRSVETVGIPGDWLVPDGEIKKEKKIAPAVKNKKTCVSRMVKCFKILGILVAALFIPIFVIKCLDSQSYHVPQYKIKPPTKQEQQDWIRALDSVRDEVIKRGKGNNIDIYIDPNLNLNLNDSLEELKEMLPLMMMVK
jgi:hypothetical protein